ncbi:unnamed protein product, partial [Staurois parvus]
RVSKWSVRPCTHLCIFHSVLHFAETHYSSLNDFLWDTFTSPCFHPVRFLESVKDFFKCKKLLQRRHCRKACSAFCCFFLCVLHFNLPSNKKTMQ